MHMFPGDVFQPNSLEDRPLRARRLPARELEPDYVAEDSGQTMRYFLRPTCANSWPDSGRIVAGAANPGPDSSFCGRLCYPVWR